MKEHVIKFFQFLEAKEGKNAPLRVKIMNHELFSFSKDELDVKGDLSLSGTNIKSLPNGLQVGWSFDLSGCTSLTSLPNGLRVSGHLHLSGCTSLTSLPDDLYVDQSLYLDDCTSLKSLPNGLHVGEDLDLSGTNIKSLPDGLRVDGGLILNGCTSLKSLPNGLQVVGNLYLRKTLFAKMYNKDDIRDMIEATGGYVKRDIYI